VRSSEERARGIAALAVAVLALGIVQAASADPSPSEATPCPPIPVPRSVPVGWVEYGDWSCACRFYVPATKHALPPPIHWEPCSGVSLARCEAMVTDWTHGAVPIALNPRLDRDLEGNVVLDFTRDATDAHEPHTLHLIAYPDGPVLNAMLKPWLGESLAEPRCYLVNEAMHEGRYLRVPRATDVTAIGASQGALVGTIDRSQPRVLARIRSPLPFKYSWAVGARWIVRLGESLNVLGWDGEPGYKVTAPADDPEGLAPSQLLVHGSAVFWTTADLRRSGINVWEPERGVRPFQRWVGDDSRGAGNLGTDGIDLVWSYGQDRQSSDRDYPTRWIMTAPFVTDPAALRPRRLRTQASPVLAEREYQVGCGYAAHAAGASGVQVVRLSDGWGWFLPSETPALRVRRPIGLTCRHIYVLAQVVGRWTLARFELGSLGRGSAPD
jgi:hypothetical protein